MTNAMTTGSNATKDLITAALENIGMQRALSSGQFGRARMQGLQIELTTGGESEYFQADPKTGEPALYALILGMPENHQALWIDRDAAEALGRDLSPFNDPKYKGYFCKSYDTHPDQGLAKPRLSEEGYSCDSCAAMPFRKKGESPLKDGKKCGWRSDVLFRRYERSDDGWSLPDETTYTMTLAASGVIQMQGSSRNKQGGVVSELNFYTELGLFMVNALKVDATDPDAVRGAVIAGGEALQQGRIIVGISVKNAKNEDGSFTWPVPIFTPVDIMAEAPEEPKPAQLAAADDADACDSALPF